jgi:cytochrome oxidase Cu insertion factor (SCO1/SenC/PrrC family)
MRWLIIALAMVGAVSFALAQPSSTPDALKPYIGKPVPNVTLVDVDGKKHKLSSFKGKVLLLNFWSPH